MDNTIQSDKNHKLPCINLQFIESLHLCIPMIARLPAFQPSIGFNVQNKIFILSKGDDTLYQKSFAHVQILEEIIWLQNILSPKFM